MATTLIENIVNELTELVVQSVMKEFQAQETRLVALEEKTFKKLDDLQAEVQSLRDCNAVNIQAMRTQQTKIDNLENILARLEVISLSKTQVESIVEEVFQEINIDYQIERALGDVDFTDYGLFTEHDLIEFLNDRVRLTTE